MEVVRLDDLLLDSKIAAVDFMGGVDEFNGLNERGQVAFQFELDNGRRGIAIWSIPEPSISLLLAVGFAVLVGFWRKRKRTWGPTPCASLLAACWIM